MAEETDTQNPPASPTRLPASDGSPLVLSSGHVFTAKKPCPYCGGKITCTVSAWEEEDDESWIATDLDIECDSEPPIDSRRWKEWEREHGGGDWGEAWHDMKEALLRDMKRRFRFDMENEALQRPDEVGSVARSGSPAKRESGPQQSAEAPRSPAKREIAEVSQPEGEKKL